MSFHRWHYVRGFRFGRQKRHRPDMMPGSHTATIRNMLALDTPPFPDAAEPLRADILTPFVLAARRALRVHAMIMRAAATTPAYA